MSSYALFLVGAISVVLLMRAVGTLAVLIRTRRIIATVRQQQRSPRVLERNRAARLRDEMRHGRMNQVAAIYRELETCE